MKERQRIKREGAQVLRKLFKGKTIKARIMRYNVLLVCVIAIVFSISTYMTANQKTVEIAENSLRYHVESIANRYRLAYEVMMTIVLNTEGGDFELAQLGGFGTVEARKKGLAYAKTLTQFCAVTGYGNYISKLAIFDEAGHLVQAGKTVGAMDDASKVIETEWFYEELEKPAEVYQLDMRTSPFFNVNGSILPVVRHTEDGYVLLCLSPDLYMDILKQDNNGQEIFVATGNGKRIASLQEEAGYREENDALVRSLLLKEELTGMSQMTVHGKQSMVAWERDGRSGIIVVEVLPVSSLGNEKLMVLQTVLIMSVGCLILGWLLSFLFTNQVKKPIDKLVGHIGKVAEGDFIQDKSIETEDEIGVIGRTVNTMSGQIEQLMEQKVEDEKEKSGLELKMLQAQINPHFLYNTLDSIKWIAVVQKNSGIVKVVSALSGLLKNMAKGYNEQVTVRKELDFLGDYVTIEKIKYAERFDVEIRVEEPELYKARMIKLTLQPLIENAIFSGIEPSGRNGLITVHIYAADNKLYTVIRDNGVGIEPDKLKNIWKESTNTIGDRMSSIGLVNVDRRIKLTYGEEYGLSIASEVDVYTEVTVMTPLEFEEDGGI